MRISPLVTFLFSPLLAFAAVHLGAADAPLPAGVMAVWDLSKASHETTPTRERICINGLWRWQPSAASADGKIDATPPTDGWGFHKVPGVWPGGFGYQASDTAQQVYAHPAWAATDLTKLKFAWYQREIMLPASWAGRTILLELNWVQSSADVTIDGRSVGNIPFPGGALDITAACRPGQTQMLSVWVSALLSPEMTSNSHFNVSVTSKATVDRRGLCGDAYIEGVPAKAAITDVIVQPSVRKWELGLGVGLARLDEKAQYRLKGELFDGARKVHAFEGAPFKAADMADGRFTCAFPWHPEKLWDAHTPGNLYVLRLSLIDGNGANADTYRDIRFGFRELWIDGRDFRLNGTRLHLNAIQHSAALRSIHNASYAGARETFLRMRGNNFNLAYAGHYSSLPGVHLGYEDILRAADDTGMFISFSLPEERDYGYEDKKTFKRLTRDSYAAHTAYFIRQAGNHPSVLFYAMNHNQFGFSDEPNPQTLHALPDFVFDKKTGQRNDRVNATVQSCEAVVRRSDPSRVIYHHGGSLGGAVISPNIYLNQIPIQEVSDWFSTWAAKGDRPLFVVEYGAPLDVDFSLFRGYLLDKNGKLITNDKGERRSTHFYGKWIWSQYHMAGWGAQLLGDRAFALDEQERVNLRWEAERWNGKNPYRHWEYPIAHNSAKYHTACFRESQALYDAENWPAFRALGVSGLCNWKFTETFFMKENVNQGKPVVMHGKFPALPVATDWERLQRPGYSPDWEYAPEIPEREAATAGVYYCHRREDWLPQPGLGEAWLRVSRPALAFIAGKASCFTGKDHNFHPGETVEKQIIVINDSRAQLKGECAWSIDLTPAVGEKQRIAVETGEQVRLPVRIALPDTLKPGEYIITLKASFDSGEVQEDAFPIHVLARPAKPRIAVPVALFDPVGQTRESLAAMGIQPTVVGADAKPVSGLLVIGANALTVDGPAPDCSAVRDGLRVVVFEQSAAVLEQRLGFRSQEYRLRNVFPRIPDHPLLAGLDARSWWNWRGSSGTRLSDLVPRLSVKGFANDSVQLTKWCGQTLKHAWRGSDYGAVASVLIEKPACGDFLSILEGGFYLQYGQLLEYREGNGLVIFCQLDVSKRGEPDPAAEILVRNVLGYAAAWKPVPGRQVRYAGDPAGKLHLEHAGLTVKPYAGGALAQTEVLVAGPEAGKALAAHRADIAAWLAQGGHLLGVGLTAEDAKAFLPFAVTMKQQEHIDTTFPAPGCASLLAGASPAGVHSRVPRQFNLLVAGDGIEILGNGVLAKATGANVVFCQIVPWQYDYTNERHNLKTIFRTSSCLLARLLGNMGARTSTPLLARLATPATRIDLTDKWPEVFGVYVNTPKDPTFDLDPDARWRSGFYLDTPVECDDPYRFFIW